MDLRLEISHRTRTTSRPVARRRSRTRVNVSGVLLRVMVLGSGFIMVAAIFPVAIQQAKSTNEETVAAAIARSALGTMQLAAVSPATVVDGDNTDGTDLKIPALDRTYMLTPAKISGME